MALPSVPELVRLFDDEEVAREAHAAEAIASWPSLRVLAALCEAGEATTGEATTGEASTGDIARAVNMDMGEVRDHLDALAELGIVAESDGEWEVAVERVRLEVEMSGELRVSHAVEGECREPTPPERGASDDGETGGLLARLKRWLPNGG